MLVLTENTPGTYVLARVLPTQLVEILMGFPSINLGWALRAKDQPYIFQPKSVTLGYISILAEKDIATYFYASNHLLGALDAAGRV